MEYCRAHNSAAIKEQSSDKGEIFVKRTIFANNGFMKDDDKTFQAQEESEIPDFKKNTLDLDATKQCSKLEQDYAKLLEEVKVLSEKIRDMNTKEKLQDDWKFATQVLDRFFMVTLAVSIFIAFLSVFLDIPDGAILTGT